MCSNKPKDIDKITYNKIKDINRASKMQHFPQSRSKHVLFKKRKIETAIEVSYQSAHKKRK